MRRYVVNSADQNDFYSFFMPIVCHVWKEYMGYEPIAILYGDEASWNDNPKSRCVLAYIKQAALIRYVGEVPGYKVSTIMQLSRMFGHVIPGVGDSDYLLTSDVDMVPLDRSYFNQQDTSFEFNLFSADAYADLSKGHVPPKYPMCYIGARRSGWKAVLGTRTRDLHTEVSLALEGRPDLWENDEQYFAEKLFDHEFHRGPFERMTGQVYRKGKCECIARTWKPYAHRRLDRGSWSFQGEAGMIDCHAFRPGYASQEVFLRILTSYFPASQGLFTSYFREFLALKAACG